MLSSIRETLSAALNGETADCFENRLARADAAHPPRAWGLLAVLVVACFVPRALMATRVNAVCVDGVVYFRLAGELEREQVAAQDGGRLQSGTYPVILATLHHLGLEWETAAKLFGVLISTAAVVPLFGWVRRQFDDRIAFVAGLIYAVHPKLIEWSPEAVREPTFWFFFVLSLYALWRATTEVDWRYFALGGATTALSCLTRFEGWFLLIPLAGWTGVRCWHVGRERIQLIAGGSIALAAIPAVLVAFGLSLPGGSAFSHVRVEPVQRAAAWAWSWRAPAPIAENAPAKVVHTTGAPRAPAPAVADVAAATTAPPAVAADWTANDAVSLYVRTIERGLTPLFALFMFGGYFARWKLFHRSDNLPILLMVLAVAFGIWIHLWYSHQASSRYVLTIVLLSTRSAATGVIDFGRVLSKGLSRRRAVSPQLATTGVLAVLGLVGTVDAVTSDFRSRATLASIGTWIHDRYDTAPVVVGSENQLMLVGYYAQGTAYSFPAELHGMDLANWIAHVKADVVVISKRRQAEADYQPILDQAARLGLEVVPPEDIAGPANMKSMIVLARIRPPPDGVRQAARKGRSVP